MRKIKKSAEFLLENGLLFEINRQVLHPLGLALEVDVNDSGKIDFGDVWDCREDPEGILFDPETFAEGAEKFNKYMEEYGQNCINNRLGRLGFIYQKEEDKK